MDFIPLISALGGGGVVGIIVSRTWDQVAKQHELRASRRRSEIDRADEAERRARRLEEALAIHRRTIIDAPCLGPEHLPPYPARKDTP